MSGANNSRVTVSYTLNHEDTQMVYCMMRIKYSIALMRIITDL